MENKITTCIPIDNVCGTTVRFCMTSVLYYFCCNPLANLQSWLELIFFCAITVVLNLLWTLGWIFGVFCVYVSYFNDKFRFAKRKLEAFFVYLIHCTFSLLLTPYPSSIRDKMIILIRVCSENKIVLDHCRKHLIGKGDPNFIPGWVGGSCFIHDFNLVSRSWHFNYFTIRWLYSIAVAASCTGNR